MLKTALEFDKKVSQFERATGYPQSSSEPVP